MLTLPGMSGFALLRVAFCRLIKLLGSLSPGGPSLVGRGKALSALGWWRDALLVGKVHELGQILWIVLTAVTSSILPYPR